MIELDIVERLRGKVRVPVNDGAGLLDGKDFFESSFPTSKAALEAADEIERLRAAAVPAPDAGLVEREAIADIKSHKDVWRAIIEGERDRAKRTHETDDASYLTHELAVFDRVVAALLSRSGAGEPVAWRHINDALGYDLLTRTRLAHAQKDDGWREEALYATPAPQAGRDPATIEAWKAGRDAALEVIQNVRHAGAANFTDARYAGQRGVDRADALFDVYKKVKDLAAPVLTEER